VIAHNSGAIASCYESLKKKVVMETAEWVQHNRTLRAWCVFWSGLLVISVVTAVFFFNFTVVQLSAFLSIVMLSQFQCEYYSLSLFNIIYAALPCLSCVR
jgi:hypothetical protein